jgi:type I restriction enzyme, R subunit
MNEADTRAELIDPQLTEAGWKSDAEKQIRVRREYQINEGQILSGGQRRAKLIADYVLEYKGVKLAVIEAKSDELEVGEGVAQAKLYAQKLRLQNSFATNGKQIYAVDHHKKTEGLVKQFPSPDELWDQTFGQINDWLDKFNAVPFEDMNGTRQARYYQELAVQRAVEAVANDKQRVLLTLATGTGKTFIAFQIAWKLFKSRWTQQKDGKRQPRILFLADRNILASQAYLDFGAFDPAALVRINPSDIAKKGEVPKNGSVFFTIFQTFMSGKDGAPYFGQYEPDFFDLVIIDECHRGGANDESSWRDILNHFSSAVHLGLTATPKRKDNTDTYAYFGEPVFTYSLKEGIEDGFLTPFKLKRIQSTMDEYVYSDDDEVIEGEVDDGRVYTEKDFNRIIVIEQRERERVKEMLATINTDEKTIVFCANQAHAALVRDLINQESPGVRVDYCVRVTAMDGSIGDTYLKQFQDNEKSIPTILTTSQKLTTGVDARNVRNIVLMRPVNTMIEFKQIVGRGTRLFEGKNFFTIIDFVNAYQHFNDPEWDGEPIAPEPPAEPPLYPDPPIDPPSPPDGPEDPPKPKLKIKLADGKVRQVKVMRDTYFYVDGRPVSAEDFLKHLFNVLKLPDVLEGEDNLRKLWSNPMTRRDLMKKLDGAGCHKDDLEKLQSLIEAEDSDLFDVLEYIVYLRPVKTRSERVTQAQDNILNLLNEEQREFVSYVLRNYQNEGVDELDVGKLSNMLTAKYGSLHAAQSKLGSVEDIQKTFVDFQKYLYEEAS